MTKTDFDYRSTHGQGGGDSERLTDQIFGATRVQAKVRLEHGIVQLRTHNLADFYIARSYLANQRGIRRDSIYRSI